MQNILNININEIQYSSNIKTKGVTFALKIFQIFVLSEIVNFENF